MDAGRTLVPHLVLVPSPCSAASTRKCSSIYKGFAHCLLALGDSLSVSTQKEEDTQEIDSICKSWDDFHDCANVAMAGCPEEAATVWESLRQESKKMQFSGNLYEMCSSRSQSQSPDETNQEPDEDKPKMAKDISKHLNLHLRGYKMKIKEEFRRITTYSLEETFTRKLDEYSRGLLRLMRAKGEVAGCKMCPLLDTLNDECEDYTDKNMKVIVKHNVMAEEDPDLSIVIEGNQT
ncbi:neuritin [Pimephales promelas]|nr:neuritin [Pimephales promelas]